MGEIAWSIWAVLVLISAVVGWVSSGVIQRQWRQEFGWDGSLVHAWGRPDLAAPSTSPEARAEVAELEALWRKSGRRRR